MWLILAVVRQTPDASILGNPGWIVALLALISAVLGAIAFIGRWAWRLARRTGHFLDDYFGEEAHAGLPATPGVMARLAAVERKLSAVENDVAAISRQVHVDGGHSLLDVVRRTASDVEEIKKTMRRQGGERT